MDLIVNIRKKNAKYFQRTGKTTIAHSYLFKISQSFRTSSNVRRRIL